MTLRKCLAVALAAAIPAALAQDNPAARRRAMDIASLGGQWNGANLENRSNCTTAGVNGIHGTYAQWFIIVDAPHGQLDINEQTVTNLTCNYTGAFSESDRLLPSWIGSFSCSDGKRGTFQSKSFLITPTEMQIRLQIKLENSERCDIDSILGGSRFF